MTTNTTNPTDTTNNAATPGKNATATNAFNGRVQFHWKGKLYEIPYDPYFSPSPNIKLPDGTRLFIRWTGGFGPLTYDTIIEVTDEEEVVATSV